MTLGVKAFLNPWALARFVSASRSPFVDISFRSREKTMHALVPSSELWVAVKDVLVLEDYELDPWCSFSSLPPGSLVVDAGSFVGFFSLKVSPYAHRIIALEPSRENFPLLLQNLAANRISNIEPRRVALSARRGIVEFHDMGTSSAMVSGSSEQTYKVESIAFRDLVEELGRIDLLKMDIEGAEYDVLLETPSAVLNRVDKVVAEIHFRSPFDRARFPSLLKRLESSGMVVTVIQMPRVNSRYGLTKPWHCSLRKFNGRSTIPYRLLISLAYGLGPLTAGLKSKYDAGGTAMIFAHRPAGGASHGASISG